MFFFNWEYYINKYPDLSNYKINNEPLALKHWNEYGKKEKRICSDIPIYFNWKLYLLNNRDLIDCNINNEHAAWQHYVYHGVLEKRYPFTEQLLKIYCVQYH